MKITWDEPKRRANLEARGLDFADLDLDFFADSVLLPAKHGRLKAIGPHDGKLLTVIFKPLGREALAVISMRPASRTERRAYEQDP